MASICDGRRALPPPTATRVPCALCLAPLSLWLNGLGFFSFVLITWAWFYGKKTWRWWSLVEGPSGPSRARLGRREMMMMMMMMTAPHTYQTMEENHTIGCRLVAARAGAWRLALRACVLRWHDRGAYIKSHGALRVPLALLLLTQFPTCLPEPTFPPHIGQCRQTRSPPPRPPAKHEDAPPLTIQVDQGAKKPDQRAQAPAQETTVKDCPVRIEAPVTPPHHRPRA